MYQQYLAYCLDLFNEKYAHIYGEKKLTSSIDSELVEFSEDGSAYPHGIGGTNYIQGMAPSFRIYCNSEQVWDA